MEPNVMVNVAAALVFAAIAAYVLMLAVRQVNATIASGRTAELEQRLLQRRIDDLIEQRRFERDREELSWSGWRKFEVAKKVMEGGDICSFYLEPHDKQALPPFFPGQYLTFQLRMAGGGNATVRCYSLSDSPNGQYYRISVKRQVPPKDPAKADVSKSSSNWLHDNANQGDILDVKAPSGHFFLDLARHHPVVLIGGGIGLTPVLSMLNTLVDRGSEQEIWFFYGVRHGREHIMREHLDRIAREHPNVRFYACYSDPEEGETEGVHYQHKGRVGVDLFKQLLPSNNYDFYFCGPPPMMTSLYEGLRDWGVPEERIHFEAFGPASVKRVSQAAQTEAPAAAAGPAIQVTFARSNKSVTWDTSFTSLLDFAEANNVPLDSGCRAGNCGTCLTALKSGNVRYVTTPGSQPDAGSCLTCCSVPAGDLVIDA